jgi:xanthine dehydrogenase accessory factor
VLLSTIARKKAGRGQAQVIDDLEKVYEAILAALRSGMPAAVVTLIRAADGAPRAAGAKMVVYGDGRTLGTVGGGRGEALVVEAALAALGAGESTEFELAGGAAAREMASCEVGSRFLIEVLPHRATVVIIGAGHVAQALAELAAFLGFSIVVVDDRDELLTRSRFPRSTDLLLGPPADVVRELPLGPDAYVALVTHHESRDESTLAVLAEREAAYVGLMGSRRRSRVTFDRARALGVPAEFLDGIHTPIGLSIGAQTPREVAVSILAEIIAVCRGERGS